MAESNGNPTVPEDLFHTTLTVVDYHTDTSGSSRDVHVLATHTNLAAAKAFALMALKLLGYDAEDFDEYTTRVDTAAEEWTHGDGVMVYAKAPKGQEFLVGLDTKPNTESLPALPLGDTLLLPEGHDHLHYVLHNRTDYNQDKSGAYQTTEIEGCYVLRDRALAAAKEALREARQEYAQYDVHLGVLRDRALAAAKEALREARQEYAQYDEREEKEPDAEWPFGEDVIVHAVAQTGENHTVAVKTVPGAHKIHGKAC